MDKGRIDFLVTVAENGGYITLSCKEFLQLVRERDEAVSNIEDAIKALERKTDATT